jgi:serine/threonine protein kinase
MTTESDYWGEDDDPNSFKMLTKTAGTLAFAAPERIGDNAYYTEKIDIWSSGIVLVMMLTG